MKTTYSPTTIGVPLLVEKENIPHLSFKKDIIATNNPSLNKQIELAVRLGNAYHTKVSIVFLDDIGLKRVDTTIWAKGEKFISLKGGIWLSIDRILSITF